MTPNSRWTSSLSSTADGSSITMSRASWDSARAMLTICWLAADRDPSSAVGRISGCPRRPSSAAAARLAAAGRETPKRERSRPRKTLSATVSPDTRSSSW